MQRTVNSASKRTVYPISLGEEEKNALDVISEKTGVSRADAIREAIRAYAEDVKGMEVVKLRVIPKEQAKKEILEFLRKNDRAWTNDIADALRLDIVFVNTVLEELWGEEKVIEHRH